MKITVTTQDGKIIEVTQENFRMFLDATAQEGLNWLEQQLWRLRETLTNVSQGDTQHGTTDETPRRS